MLGCTCFAHTTTHPPLSSFSLPPPKQQHNQNKAPSLVAPFIALGPVVIDADANATFKATIKPGVSPLPFAYNCTLVQGSDANARTAVEGALLTGNCSADGVVAATFPALAATSYFLRLQVNNSNSSVEAQPYAPLSATQDVPILLVRRAWLFCVFEGVVFSGCFFFFGFVFCFVFCFVVFCFFVSHPTPKQKKQKNNNRLPSANRPASLTLPERSTHLRLPRRRRPATFTFSSK